MLARLAARLPGLGHQLFLIPKISQRVLIATGRKDHVAAVTAVAAIRAAFVYKFFVPETSTAAAAAARFNRNRRLIYKHFIITLPYIMVFLGHSPAKEISQN